MECAINSKFILKGRIRKFKFKVVLFGTVYQMFYNKTRCLFRVYSVKNNLEKG